VEVEGVELQVIIAPVLLKERDGPLDVHAELGFLLAG
jgi:hypothetical protein